MSPCRLALSVLLAGLVFPAAAAPAADLRSPSFDYTDIDRFAAAIDEIRAGANPTEAFGRYLDGASPGLFGWMQRYGNIVPERYARGLERFPEYFEYLGGLRPALEEREEEIAADLVALRDLVGEALGWSTLSILPTYYFVTPLGGGGSATPIANMIAVDYYGRNPGAPLDEFEELGFFPEGRLSIQPLDSLVVVAAHEMVHWYQILVQGGTDYGALYRRPGADTLLARAVREGGADFLAFLASGKATADRQAYGLEHENALWAAFGERLDQLTNDNPGWFSGSNELFPDAPWQIGYFVGMRMCQAYYEAATDKNEAVRTILSAQTQAEYDAIAAAYEARLSAEP